MRCIIDHLLLLLTMYDLPSLQDAPTAYYPNTPCCSYVCVSCLSICVFNVAAQFSLSMNHSPHVMSLRMIDVPCHFPMVVEYVMSPMKAQSYPLFVHTYLLCNMYSPVCCKVLFLMLALFHILHFFVCCVFVRVILVVHPNFVAVRHTFADILLLYI
jgi:hypothetical protein